MKKIIVVIIVCMIIISGMFMYNKSDTKDLLEDSSGPIIAAVIDGKASTSFPTTNKYVATVECTRNGKKIDANESITWNGTKWILTTSISDGNVRCNAIFRTPNFAETILADNETRTPITTPGAAVSTADEALLASAEDDYGTSYYFRGAVTNNYVEFANKCWRIVRVGGDGSVKLILHNDNTAKAANPCNSANNSTTAAFARYSGTTYTSAFNTNTDDNAYVGFMYGMPGSSTYADTHANTNKSTILTNLETWYNNNLKTYESVIDDNVWCNDKTNVTDTTYKPLWGDVNGLGLGYGKNVTYYGATKRLVSASKSAGGTGPSLKCNGELSKISSKVGLITADELAFAGYAYNIRNTVTYLKENTSGEWWSLSPSDYISIYANVWYVQSYDTYFTTGHGGTGGRGVHDSYGVRPLISLKSTTNVTGNGSSDKPYKVI